MSKVVSAMDMRQNFGTLLNQVAIKDEEIVIERAGKQPASGDSFGTRRWQDGT